MEGIYLDPSVTVAMNALHGAKKCFYCGKRFGVAGRSITIDHVVPLKHGGAHAGFNLVAACKSCNCHKHTKHINDFIGSGQMHMTYAPPEFFPDAETVENAKRNRQKKSKESVSIYLARRRRMLSDELRQDTTLENLIERGFDSEIGECNDRVHIGTVPDIKFSRYQKLYIAPRCYKLSIAGLEHIFGGTRYEHM